MVPLPVFVKLKAHFTKMLKYENKEHVSRGGHLTKFHLKVSPVAVFIKRNYVAWVPGHFNQWF